eukprot:6205086-Pleurochrysis_carterae.AAC.2
MRKRRIMLTRAPKDCELSSAAMRERTERPSRFERGGCTPRERRRARKGRSGGRRRVRACEGVRARVNASERA